MSKKHHETVEQHSVAAKPNTTDGLESPATVEQHSDAANPNRIAELEKEALDWKDKYMRSMAEFENFRKRSQQEKADWIRLATKEFAMQICDVADNFERALLQGDEQAMESPFAKGILMIEKQLRQALEKEGVKKIEALGEKFDPEFHDALAHIPSEMEENTIAAIIQNGYTMHDKVLRPARVAVSSGNVNNKMKSLEE
ncbi:MAG: nucleotide exchange factor GrpE [Candidatus Cloacimonetes bacterium]|nr:nucleotide exchange factor GrpE [Candidatus Cloacimonadota bacterium]